MASSEGNGVRGSPKESASKLDWEAAPYAAKSAQRARKDTVAIPAKRLRSFLDEPPGDEVEGSVMAGWLTPGNANEGAKTLPNGAPLEIEEQRSAHSELGLGLLGPDICDPNAAPLIGFLVAFDRHSSGEVYALRPGRWIISSKDLQLSACTLLIEGGDVSPVHAILMIAEEGTVRIQDCFSVQGTQVLRSGQSELQPLSQNVEQLAQGDVLRLGSREFKLCLIPK